MHTVEIGSEIRDFVVTNFLFGKGDDLSDDESLLDNGAIDSTGVLELVSYLQERFDFHVEDDEIVPANLDSIHKLADYVGRKTVTLR
jgi:acyl carrier protein